MDNEKYTDSLIYSIHEYIVKLQCFARNNRTTLRALNSYKIFHWLYNWADWYGVSEVDKMKLENLMNCLILRNSNLILPEIIPESFYANVSSPQNIWTWQIINIEGNSVVPPPPPPDNTILTVEDVNGGFGVYITTNTPDENNKSADTTPFTLEYTPTNLIKLTAPAFLLNGNVFNYWSIDGNVQTPNQTTGATSVNVPTSIDHLAIVSYRLPQPPIGSITVHKEVFNSLGVQDEGDFSEFTVLLSRNGAEYASGTIKTGTPWIFSNLELGIYQVTESPRVGYSIELPNPKTVTLSTQTSINAEITFSNTQDLVIVPDEGVVTVTTIILDEPTDESIFEYTLKNEADDAIQIQWGSQTETANFLHVPFGTYTLKAAEYSVYTIDSIVPNDGILTVIGYFTIDGDNLLVEPVCSILINT